MEAPHSFRVDAIDAARTLRCGQTFRWSDRNGDLVGADGEAWAIVSTDGLWRSNVPYEWWTGFLGLDRIDERALIEAIDPKFSEFCEASRRIAFIRPSDPVEVLFGFLCSANNHLRRIEGMVASLAQLGEPWSSVELQRFPPAHILARAPQDEWRRAGFGYRAQWIAPTAAAIARAGDTYFDDLRRSGYALAHRELCQLPGVGRKVADCVCLYGLGQGEAVPVDTHIRRIFNEMYPSRAVGENVSDSEYRRIGDLLRDRFGTLAGHAQFLMFLSGLATQRRGAVT